MFTIWRTDSEGTSRWMTCSTREAAEATVAFRLNHRDTDGSVSYEIRSA